MTDLLVGPLALAVRYLLLLLAGWLARAGLAALDPVSGVVTIRVDDAAQVIIAALVLALALLWRRIAKRLGGAT
ncbi:hypothetical protein [Rubellimicrobium aerolatum]|uniref:Uncharacterized protein n=1 Tax=Rubellimicrobium aerolatum TaxID=490979 RepID=A0ABW0SEP6_9RHOB|nr:hypothetical protein [Rubellimicrobium aerolatum]MBP1806451.1 hypothetical protein [Rubellimicrobium aerolatum]